MTRPAAIPVYYNPRQAADPYADALSGPPPGFPRSPSAGKPQAVYDAIRTNPGADFPAVSVVADFPPAALKVLDRGGTAFLLDCDQHWGDGTYDCLAALPADVSDLIQHCSFGAAYSRPEHAAHYLTDLAEGGVLEQTLGCFDPDVLIYQAGADAHVDDPQGGVLTTEQLYERDRRVFSIAKRHGIPVAWCLAGGYQVEPDGSIPKVLEIHLNTFRAAKEVYGL